MEYLNTQYLLDKRPRGMPSDECWKLHQEKIKSLDKTSPHFAYTQEMIDGLISFKERELELWNHINYLNETYGGK